MPFQPAMEEPSKAWPSSNLLIVEQLDGEPRHVLFFSAGDR